MAHPNDAIARLMARAERRGYFNTTVDIEESAPTENPTTGEQSNAWIPLEDHIGIVAHIAPAPADMEIRRSDTTLVTDARIITLKGYFPAIDKSHAVAANGKLWGIITVAHDGQRAYTKLTVSESAL